MDIEQIATTLRERLPGWSVAVADHEDRIDLTCGRGGPWGPVWPGSAWWLVHDNSLRTLGGESEGYEDDLSGERMIGDIVTAVESKDAAVRSVLP